MDLQKFLHRQRVYLSSLLGLLKGNQSAFVDKFSQLVIRESSEHAGTSDDDELSDWADRPLDFIKRMQRSKNHIDRRFLDIFKLRLQDQGMAEKTRFETPEEVDLSQVPLQGI
mmetsp:Transcript_10913/g.14719  ORF Transcript_10913/g.14719 Transcript_10913/m.14719 type:complete len:113 (+) Transcript_10913:1421-1759(+)